MHAVGEAAGPQRRERGRRAAGAEREHAVDRVAGRDRVRDPPLRLRRVLDVDLQLARPAAGLREPGGERAAAKPQAPVAGLLVDAQGVAHARLPHPDAALESGTPLGLADVGADAQLAEAVA